jgi:alkylation response protein AidB-like acyl-CoA dehydrogenase
MRGTGSYDVQVADLFVPDSRTFVIGPISPAPAYRGHLYGLRLWFAAVPIAAIALGIASASIDDFLTLAAQKTPSYTTVGLADRSIVQDRLARALASVDAARAYLHSVLTETFEFLKTGARLDPQRGLHVQLASTHAITACQEAVDLIQSLAGTTGIREGARFEQHFRDIHTLSQHAFGSSARFESVGKLLLGRESDWGFFYL